MNYLIWLGLVAATSHAAYLNPKIVSRQMRTDFAEGKATYQKEVVHQKIDAQTFEDLELKRVTDEIQKYAPSALAKDRIAWQLRNPYLDSSAIRARQSAIQVIADNENLFALLADLFEQPDQPVKKKSRLFADIFNPNLRIDRRGLVATAPHLNFARWSTVGQVVLTALGAYWQWAIITGIRSAIISPTYGNVFEAALPVLALAMNSNYYKGDLPLVEVKRRAEQARKLIEADELGGTALLDALKQKCLDNSACLRKVNRYGALLPKNDLALKAIKVTSLSQYLAFPLSLYFPKNQSEVYELLGVVTDLEVLYAYAKLYRERRAELSFPEILDSGDATIEIEDGNHPLLWLLHHELTPNSIRLVDGTRKTIAITGPNMGGKTTVQQMYLINSVLAMAGLPVPARFMRLTPHYVLTNFNKSEGRVSQDTSTFEAQAERITGVIEFAQSEKRKFPVAVGMDEIMTGTSGREHRVLERAGVAVLFETPGVLTTVATHDRSLAQFVERLGEAAANVRVSLEGHKILDGPSTDFNAFAVMREAGVPEILLEASLEYLKQANCAANLEE